MAQSERKPAAKVDFADFGQARRWFEGQPREVCVALVMRSALRILPTIQFVDAIPSFFQGVNLPVLRRVALPVFRACFVAWGIAKYPSQRNRLRAAAGAAHHAATDAEHVAATTAAALAAEIDAVDAYIAVAAATGAAATVAATDATTAGTAGTTAANAAATSYNVTDVLRADAIAIEQGFAVTEIVDARLWPGERHERIFNTWVRLRTLLLHDEANNWDPWVQWYERVRDGRPSFGEAFDLAVASLTDEQWNEEPRPAAVNRRIAALLAEHTRPDPIPPEIDEETLPEQTPRAPIFRPDQSGVIDLAPPTAPDRLADTAEVRDLYDETREKLDELISVGRNMLGNRLARASDRLRSRMPEAMPEAVERLVWSSGNTLRSILTAHDAVADDRDPHPDKLDRGAAERLRDVVDTFNQLAVADPSLRARDTGRPGPQEHARTLKEIEIVVEPVARAATDRNITTLQAGGQLSESAAIAEEAGSSLTDRLAVELARDTNRNFFAGTVVRAYRFVRSLPAQARGEGGFISKEYFSGVYKSAGGATVAGVTGAVAGAWYIRWELIQFIVANAEILKLYAAYAFEQSPGFKQMIDWLAAHVRIER